MKDKILVIDDEAGIRSSLRGILEDEGYSVKTTETGEEGLNFLKAQNFDLILLDIWLPEMDGIEALKKIKMHEENAPVVMISGHGTVETAVKATKLGAYDFLEKPLTLEKVVLTVKNALKQKRLEEENIQLREKIKAKYHLVGKSRSIQKLRDEIKKAAPTDARVLIYGENGTGK
ncbi:MAG: sigma-54-dependent Fis family transcriptional regulator, partial [Candidatus Aminicenantes bacterium]